MTEEKAPTTRCTLGYKHGLDDGSGGQSGPRRTNLTSIPWCAFDQGRRVSSMIFGWRREWQASAARTPTTDGRASRQDCTSSGAGGQVALAGTPVGSRNAAAPAAAAADLFGRRISR